MSISTEQIDQRQDAVYKLEERLDRLETAYWSEIEHIEILRYETIEENDFVPHYERCELLETLIDSTQYLLAHARMRASADT